MEAANEVGVTPNQKGYNGDLTSRQAGSIDETHGGTNKMKEAKTICEQPGGTYREENGNLVPNVEVPDTSRQQTNCGGCR